MRAIAARESRQRSSRRSFGPSTASITHAKARLAASAWALRSPTEQCGCMVEASSQPIGLMVVWLCGCFFPSLSARRERQQEMGQQHKTKQAMANELKTGHRRSSLFPRSAAFGVN